MHQMLPAFPMTFVQAGKAAETAWLDERKAREAIGGGISPPANAIVAWHAARDIAIEAQAIFDLEVARWRRLFDPV